MLIKAIIQIEFDLPSLVYSMESWNLKTERLIEKLFKLF